MGLQLAYTPSDRYSFTYNNFIGPELDNQWRYFNDFVAKVNFTSELSLGALYDIGFQEYADRAGSAIWQAYGVLAKYQFHPKFSMTARVEQYFDPRQVIVTTGSANGFQVTGASINADVTIHKQILWRTEFRSLWAKDSIYTAKSDTSKNDSFVVTSLALWL
ncbi:MAG: outer membrane beta-barrel protein [Bacteriovoracia bacterium]